MYDYLTALSHYITTTSMLQLQLQLITFIICAVIRVKIFEANARHLFYRKVL